ncbi:MAG: Dimethylmenaquinone methyltransferase [Bradyrhizobium sp.]|nr:Dimethylmenaquinone methyltransferase [Bradyrhizobium sp.]
MYTINTMPAQIDCKLIEGLLASDTGSIGHFVDSGVMASRVAAQVRGAKIAGTAVTVRSTVPDSVIGHYALKFVRPGDVLLIERGADRRTACFGATSSLAAALAGVRALIIDGAGNDIAEAAEAGLPTWCDGVTPLTTKYRNLGGALNVPISVGDVTVNPGDAILADDNGVLVIPAQDVERIVQEAARFTVQEAELRANIRANPHLRLPEITGSYAMVEKALAEQRGSGPDNR